MYHLLMYNIVDISCGLAHNFALGYEKQSDFGIQDKSLKVLTWGYGANGALGLGSKDDIYIPTVNDFFNEFAVKSVLCGYYHSLVLTSKFYLHDILCQTIYTCLYIRDYLIES